MDKKNRTPLEQFNTDIENRSKIYERDKSLPKMRKEFHEYLARTEYTYNFFWLGRPFIQLPQDMQLMQEIIWEVAPDLIIETGIAWGGSLVFSASMMVLLEACGKIKKGEVIGVDVDIRAHNKKAIAEHPLHKKIKTFEGSSVDPKILDKITKIAKKKKKVMVFLDSNHTHEHVLNELKAYSPLVSIGSYIMVGDTMVEDAPGGVIPGRPWGPGNNPKSAMWEFMKGNKKFKIDKTLDSKTIITGSPEGFLKRIK